MSKEFCQKKTQHQQGWFEVLKQDAVDSREYLQNLVYSNYTKFIEISKEIQKFVEKDAMLLESSLNDLKSTISETQKLEFDFKAVNADFEDHDNIQYDREIANLREIDEWLVTLDALIAERRFQECSEQHELMKKKLIEIKTTQLSAGNKEAKEMFSSIEKRLQAQIQILAEIPKEFF